MPVRRLTNPIAVAFLAALSHAVAQADAPQDASAPADPLVDSVGVETLVDGLEHPWSIAFLPDGRELVTERPGRLRSIEDGLLSAPIAGVPPVFAESQGGLLDVVPHPEHATNGWIYLTFVHGDAARNATRLVRARLEGAALVDVEVLFTAEPWKDTPVHHGGRMAFLPDGTLLLSVGDGFDYREHAQRLDNHFGKIVRLDDAGGVPADNPFVGDAGALPHLWSYGHRNPQGIVVDADTGAVYAHEHGPAGGDELNLIVRGGNYGWPIATRGRDYSGAAISPYVAYPGTLPPLVDWTPSIAPAGLAMGVGDAFPSLRGEPLVATLKSRELLRVHLDPEGRPIGQSVLLSDAGRLRDVRVAPDGSLRVLVDSADGAVLKLTP